MVQLDRALIRLPGLVVHPVMDVEITQTTVYKKIVGLFGDQFKKPTVANTASKKLSVASASSVTPTVQSGRDG